MAQDPNRGRLINFIAGLSGITPGAQANVNLDVGKRYHFLRFQATAVNYTGGTALATVKLTGGGNNDATVTPTIVNGVITAVAVVAGGTGYTTGDTLTITDATGAGFIGTVTAAAGAVTAVAVTSVGSATATDITNVVDSVKITVNGVSMRDISPLNILKIAQANGLTPRLGELPILFSPEWRNSNVNPDFTSWDLFGQSSFQVQLGISRTATSPGLVGIYGYDYQRNVVSNGKSSVAYLQPTAQHEFTWPILAGRNDINNLPFNFPISRMWLQGSNAGNISQVELYQDGNKVLEATIEQLREAYQASGDTGQKIWLGEPTYLSQSWATVNALKAAFAQPRAFDAAYISDPNQNWFGALSCKSQMVLRVYSDVAQNLTIVQETLPGGFTA